MRPKQIQNTKRAGLIIGTLSVMALISLVFQNCSSLKSNQSFVNSSGSAIDLPADGGSAVLGSEWVFYDPASDSSCGAQTFVDAQVIPISFARADGGASVQFAVQDFQGRNYWVKGDLKNGGLTNLKKDCHPIFTSGLNSQSDQHDGAGWLTGFYKASNQAIYSIVHNEFYGGAFPQAGQSFPNDGCPATVLTPDISPATCWFSVVTSAVSRDGGQNFHLDGVGTDHVIAQPSFPPKGSAYQSATGYYVNTNVLAKDAHYYVITTEAVPAEVNGSYDNEKHCLLETADLSRPNLWRGWDGRGFTINTPHGADCAHLKIPISPFYLGFNTYLGAYIALGAMTSAVGNGSMHFAYVVSSDLISWSAPVDLGIAPAWKSGLPATSWGNFNYPTLIDPAALARTDDQGASSGQVTGRDPFIIYVDLKKHAAQSSALPESRLLARSIHFSKGAERIPVATEAGLGCEDLTCVWIKGMNFSTPCRAFFLSADLSKKVEGKEVTCAANMITARIPAEFRRNNASGFVLITNADGRWTDPLPLKL